MPSLLIKKTFLLLFLFACVFAWGQNTSRDSLWKVYNNKASADTNRLKAMHEIVRSYIYDKPDTAIVLAEQELKLARATKQEKFEAKALNAMGVAFVNKQDYPKALQLYTVALEIREQINDIEGLIQTRFNIAKIYDDQGNPYKVLEFWLGQIKKLESLGEDGPKHAKEIVSCLIQAGLVYGEQGEKTQAMDNFQRALALTSGLKDTAGNIEVTHNLARLYGEMKNVAKSVECYNKALLFYRSKNDSWAIRAAYNQIGLMYDDNNDPANALVYYKRSLAMSDSMAMSGKLPEWQVLAHKSWIRGITGNIAGIYLRQGEMAQALDYASRGLEAAKLTRNSAQISWAFYRLAEVHRKLEDYSKAKRYAEQALLTFEKEPLLTAVCKMELLLSEIDSATGNGNGAYRHYKRHILLRDKLKSEEVTKAATRERYQNEYDNQKALARSEQDKKDAVANEEKRKQKVITWSVAGGLALVAVFAGFIFNSLQVTRKQKQIIEHQKTEVEKSKHIIEEKNKDITDSITYAKRIQTALIANANLLNEHLPEHFVLFKPKDIVAGDFYWAAPTTEGFLYITADCTGHGVPGAFMSLLNISKLTETVNHKKIIRPDLVLNEVRNEIVTALNPPGSKEESKDGMDAILCKIDFRSMKLEFAAANNSFYIIRNKELLVCKADKMPVGKGHDNTPFTFSEIALQQKDMIFTFTDGYADQFGGPKGKKFKYKQMEEIMLSIAGLPVGQQKEILDQKFEEWKGNLEQVDDVCIIGVRV